MSRTDFLIAATLAAFAAAPASADDVKTGAKIGDLQISAAWARATPKGAAVGVGYMKITNTGTTPDRLVGGSSPVSDRFELHEMTMANGVMKMRPLANGLAIEPGQIVEFNPGGLHVMFVRLKQPLEKGQQVKATLVFEKAGKVDVDYPVAAIGAQTSDSGNMPGMHGGGMKH
jgi:copper(I)-binding protein